MKKAFYIISGCILIAIAYNLFFLPYSIVTTGVFGVGELLNFTTDYDPALFILLVNGALLFVSYITLGKKTKEYLIPSILIPILIFFTYKVTEYIVFDPMEYILVAIVGAFLTGLGYSLLYKEGQNVGGFDLIQDVLNSVKVYRTKVFTYCIEGIILIATLLIVNFETMLYSLIAIAIIRMMATKSKIGVSTSKTFFIITKKEETVKKYIINELNHDLTEFNVKGGYSHNENKILMTVIDTKEYYRLKEGIALIDEEAFISIIDSYEVINKNLTLHKKKKGKSKKNV